MSIWNESFAERKNKDSDIRNTIHHLGNHSPKIIKGKPKNIFGYKTSVIKKINGLKNQSDLKDFSKSVRIKSKISNF